MTPTNSSSSQCTINSMSNLFNYEIPEGLYQVPDHLLDLRPDNDVDHDLLHPRPITDEKNVWFFWHSGFTQMHTYGQRTVRAYHRRFSKLGWVIRVVDCEPESPLHIGRFLDFHDPGTFPKAFREGTIGGDYAAQHYSDLVRWPLLLRHGGVYADVGMIQIGDLDRLWNETIGNPESPYEVISYDKSLSNYFLASNRNNALFEHCHRLLLALWGADGGKTSTEGMHADPLLKGVPLMGSDTMTFTENGRVYSPDEVKYMLTDYIIQGQATKMVLGLVDDEDGWDGPKYCREHVYAIDFLVGSQLINELTSWNGPEQFRLMSLPLPKEEEEETADQKKAKEIIVNCLTRSFGFKLATGLILRVYGDTLSSLWRKHVGSDIVPGTYAHWLRHATANWNQKNIPPPLEFEVTEPIKRGPLLREA
ncbi:hypothetical protein ONZ43_g2389 [Nemania bipapillata]|uniref:Uncharacterized protein n=1 Tax=Nemania bipapillata TaxID=110536 RepID=A0ACC2J0T6_9PEZI|nr:hypothetical protein ONZ43_g2389 [Nemania bipapillata]